MVDEKCGLKVTCWCWGQVKLSQITSLSLVSPGQESVVVEGRCRVGSLHMTVVNKTSGNSSGILGNLYAIPCALLVLFW